MALLIKRLSDKNCQHETHAYSFAGRMDKYGLKNRSPLFRERYLCKNRMVDMLVSESKFHMQEKTR